jgi:hypothetical protein
MTADRVGRGRLEYQSPEQETSLTSRWAHAKDRWNRAPCYLKVAAITFAVLAIFGIGVTIASFSIASQITYPQQYSNTTQISLPKGYFA